MLMNIRKHIVLLTIFILLRISPAFAQLNIPTTGMLYNTKEASLLTYNCSPLSNEKIECEFIQTSVRKKLKAQDMAQKIEEARKEFPDAIKEISSDKDNMCKSDVSSSILDILTGKKTAEEIAETAPKGLWVKRHDCDNLKTESDQRINIEILFFFDAMHRHLLGNTLFLGNVRDFTPGFILARSFG